MNSILKVELTQKLTNIIPHFLFSFTSIHTRRAYLNDLKNFCAFAHIQYLSDIDETKISLWKNHLENTLKLDPTSVRRKLNCLSALFVFAQKRKLIEVNPLQWIKKPNQKHYSKTNELTPEEMKTIFLNIKKNIEDIENSDKKNIHYQRTLQSLHLQYAVLTLLAGTGLRVSEVCQLKLCNLEIQINNNIKTFILHINRAKGNYEHKVYLNSTTAEIIFNYINKYRKNADSKNSLFVRVQQDKNNSDLSLSPKSIYTMVTKNALEINITKKVSPHSIRAGVATFLHSKSVPLARIQKQLGHRDIATTSVYIKKSNEVEESAALKLNLELKTSV